MRLNPRYPGLYPFYLGWTYLELGQYEEAITALKESLTLNPDFLYAYTTLALVYMELGQEEEARAAAAEVVRINPDFSLEVFGQTMPVEDPAVLERDIAALRKAGLE
jgi:tetratricopeptide (TPR) repeat protein